LPNVPPSTQHFLPTTLHTLRVPAWLDLDPNDLAHIHRRLPTQRVRGRSLFRSIEKLPDPNEVTESQVADSQCLPFTSAQGLLDFKESPKALVTKLEPFLGLSLCKDRPSCSIREARPPPHTFPLRRQRPIPTNPCLPLEAKFERSPTTRA
jgi:hypothetical protein